VAGAGSAPEILGVLSLIFWSLLVVVTLKYVVLMLRADNEGEGGILSLLALVQQRTRRREPLVAPCGGARPCSARRCSTATR
jgi:KUP system potassium uptake protein